MSYTLYIYYENERICKFKSNTDDLNIMYKDGGEFLILDAFKKKISIDEQIKFYKNYINTIYRQKRDCYKIRASDLLLFRDVFLALYKFNEINSEDIIILKNKIID